jgi:hypothetical protein
VDGYEQMQDAQLANIAADRAARLNCMLDVSETAGGYEAQFWRNDAALGRMVLRSAVAADRRSAVIALLRRDDLGHWESA